MLQAERDAKLAAEKAREEDERRLKKEREAELARAAAEADAARRREAERRRAAAREKEREASELNTMAAAEKDMRVFLYNEQKFAREQVGRRAESSFFISRSLQIIVVF